MNENFVAFGSGSLYPESRGGKVMQEEVHPAGSTEEKTPKTNGEKRAEEQRAEAKKRAGQKAQDREAQLRARDLERERREAELSTGKTGEAARKAIEALRAAAQPQEPGEEPEPQIPSKENPVIVSSYPHLENLPREAITKVFEGENVPLKIPQNWDKLSPLEKKKWLRVNNVVNTTELPQLVGEFKEETAKIQEATRRRLQEAGISSERKYYGQLQPRWPDNAAADVDTVYSRLAELREEQRIMGAAFVDRGDRNELHQRLQNPDLVLERFEGIEALRDEIEILEHLRSLKFLEAQIGVATFAANRFDEERAELNDRLMGFLNHDGRIDRVLQRLTNFAAQGIVNEEQQIWQDYLNHIVSFIQARGVDNQQYRFVFNAVNVINDFEERQSQLGQLNLLNSFLPQATRQQLVAARDLIDQHFRNIEQGYPGGTDELSRLYYRPVDEEATSLRDSLRTGGLVASVRDIEQRLFDSRDAIVRQAAESEAPDLRGIVEWHTINHLEEMRRQQAGEHQLGVPIRWEDSLKNTLNNLRFIEAVDFAPEDFSRARERLVRITENLTQHINQMTRTDQREEKRRAEEMLNEINEVKDAVLALYDLRVAMEGSDMNPEEVVRHFRTNVWKDTTFRVWFRRFARDHRGQEFTDNQGTFNMQDRAMNIVDERLVYERRVMDNVEDLTPYDLTEQLTANNYAQIERRRDRRPLTATERTRLENLRRDLLSRVVKKLGFAPANWDTLTPVQQDAIIAAHADEINTHWRVPYNAKLIITDWHTENTLIGAYGVEKNVGPNGEDRKRLDLRRDELLRDLKDDLLARGVAQNLIDEYERIGLLRQVINNANYLRWMLGGTSDYDGIRVFNRDRVWFRDRRRGDVYRVGAFAYSRSSNLWSGRYLDHYGEFLVDEVRGNPREANYIFQREMLGKRRSMLGHNKLTVKIINDNLRMDPEIANRLVVGGGNFEALLENKIRSLENIEKLDLNELYDYIWARGVAVEELLDDGQISFENVEWSKVFESDKANVSKFNMGDWWGDREKTYKYYSAEMFQEYAMQPNTKNFFELNSNRAFYSAREIRIAPWMKIVIPAHIALGALWRKEWKLPYKMPHAEKEEIIDYAVETHRLLPTAHHWMKMRYLGWGPLSGGVTVRTLRQWMEVVGVASKETGKGVPLILLLFLWELIKGMFSQSQAQLAGK